jgi:hypothetical protein
VVSKAAGALMPLETEHLREVLQRRAPPANPTSYPFLALAKVRNVPYCDVLRFADYCAAARNLSERLPPFPDLHLDAITMDMIRQHVFGYRDIATEVPRIAP